VIEHTHSLPVRTADFLKEKVEHLRVKSLIDCTCTTHGVPGHDAAQLLALFRELAGLDALCLVHCEDEAMTAENECALRAAGRVDPP
jgi:dihydroorotase